MIELLSVEEMSLADRRTIADGVPGVDLMQAAGAAVAREIAARWSRRPVAVLCGPGNNGGDGFVIAKYLNDTGWPVHLGLLGDRGALKGDAAVMAGRWPDSVSPLEPAILDGCELVVDALFGAGLARPLEGPPLAVIETINARHLDCVAVDMPSGVDGNSGEVLGGAPEARLTVTFFRAKPGHFLYPGRRKVGELVIADIGIPDHVLNEIAPRTWSNAPPLWLADFPRATANSHKYARGHALIVGGARMTGAARLAARAARRVGAGMLSLAAPPDALPIYQSADPGNLVVPLGGLKDFQALLAERRRNAVLVGPGSGVTRETRERVLAALGAKMAVVVDADGLSTFEERPAELFAAVASPCVLTPHEGEFARLFASDVDKLGRCRAAARESGAVVVLKGADTIIADPQGRAAINHNAPPQLASAGTGDVLAGLVVGLLAQGMPPFEAAAAAVWLHGAAAADYGPGLIAEDLAERLPSILARLAAGREGDTGSGDWTPW